MELKWIIEFIEKNMDENRNWNITKQLKSFASNIFDEDYIERGAELRRMMAENPKLINEYREALQNMKRAYSKALNNCADRFFALADSYGLTVDNFSRKSSGVAGYFQKIKRDCFVDICNSYVQKALEEPATMFAKTEIKKNPGLQSLAENEFGPLLAETETRRIEGEKDYQTALLSGEKLFSLRLLNKVDDYVHQINTEENRFLLSETPNLLRSVVQQDDASFVFEKMGAMLQHIMIDEFQDTSRMQWTNFYNLLMECLAQGKNSLIVGADLMHDYLSTYQFIDNASHTQNNIDGYVQFDWNITDQLNIVGSMRYDYFSASKQKAYTERFAVVYKLPWATLRANYASGFRAPTLKEMYMYFDMGNMGYMILGNPNLEPEKSHNYNIAIERTNRISNGGLLDGRYSFTLVGYCNRFNKRITTIDGGLYNGMESAVYWNEDGVTVWGLDASMGHVWDCGLSLKFNYAWMHETGNVINSQFDQPRSHSMTWRLGYDHRFSCHYALDASLSGRHLGKPQSGRKDVDQGYTIWKLMLQHHIWRGININTAVDNLLNYKPKAYYYSSHLTTGRSVSIGLSIDLDRI